MSVDSVVRLFDPQASHRRYGDEIEQRLRRVLEHGGFILGPEVAELEAIPLGTAKTRIRTAMQRMRSRMEVADG